jgi:ElaA protein
MDQGDLLSGLSFSVKAFDEFDARTMYDMLRLRSDVFVVEQACVFLDLDDEDQKCLHIYCTDDDTNRVVACLRIFAPDEGSGMMSRIGRVVTDQAYRSRRIGRKLMLDAIELCTTTWPKAPIKIGAQEHLDSFYGAGTDDKPGLGFVRISDVYDEDGIPHVDMVYDQHVAPKHCM